MLKYYAMTKKLRKLGISETCAQHIVEHAKRQGGGTEMRKRVSWFKNIQRVALGFQGKIQSYNPSIPPRYQCRSLNVDEVYYLGWKFVNHYCSRGERLLRRDAIAGAFKVAFMEYMKKYPLNPGEKLDDRRLDALRCTRLHNKIYESRITTQISRCFSLHSRFNFYKYKHLDDLIYVILRRKAKILANTAAADLRKLAKRDIVLVSRYMFYRRNGLLSLETFTQDAPVVGAMIKEAIDRLVKVKPKALRSYVWNRRVFVRGNYACGIPGKHWTTSCVGIGGRIHVNNTAPVPVCVDGGLVFISGPDAPDDKWGYSVKVTANGKNIATVNSSHCADVLVGRGKLCFVRKEQITSINPPIMTIKNRKWWNGLSGKCENF